MAINPRFAVRETEKGLQELDEALVILGYYTYNSEGKIKADRARWYREKKQEAVEKSLKKIGVVKMNKNINVVNCTPHFLPVL